MPVIQPRLVVISTVHNVSSRLFANDSDYAYCFTRPIAEKVSTEKRQGLERTDSSKSKPWGTLIHTLDFEKGGQKLKFVVLGVDRVCELLAVVEGLQQGLEAIIHQRHRVGHDGECIYELRARNTCRR